MENIVKEAAKSFKIKLNSYSKAKATFLLDTDSGIYAFKRQACQKETLEALYLISETLRQSGFTESERFLLSGGKPYMVFDGGIYTAAFCGDGDKCSFTERDGILHIAETLAKLHLITLDLINRKNPLPKSARFATIEKRIGEARHIKKWIDKQSRLTDVDVLFVCNYKKYIAKASEAAKIINSSLSEKPFALCLSAVREENIWIGKDGGVTFVNMENWAYNPPETDLGELIKRYIKRGGNSEVAADIISAYTSVRPLTSGDSELLRAVLSYPAKFFELSNKYYNSRRLHGGFHTYQKLNSEIARQEKIYALLDGGLI